MINDTKSKKYFCNKCKKTHYSTGNIYYTHLKSSNNPQKAKKPNKDKKKIEDRELVRKYKEYNGNFKESLQEQDKLSTKFYLDKMSSLRGKFHDNEKNRNVHINIIGYKKQYNKLLEDLK